MNFERNGNRRYSFEKSNLDEHFKKIKPTKRKLSNVIGKIKEDNFFETLQEMKEAIQEGDERKNYKKKRSRRKKNSKKKKKSSSSKIIFNFKESNSSNEIYPINNFSQRSNKKLDNSEDLGDFRESEDNGEETNRPILNKQESLRDHVNMEDSMAVFDEYNVRSSIKIKGWKQFT